MEMEEGKCPIWETPAKIGKGGWVDSPRAGGIYKVDDLLRRSLGELEPDERVKLTDWLIEQREAGVEVPEIDVDVLECIKTRDEKAMSERIKSLMSYIAKKFRVSKVLEVQDRELAMMLTAYSSSIENEEMYECLKGCVSKEYLEERGIDRLWYAMTVKGKTYADEIRKEKNQKSDQKAGGVYKKSLSRPLLKWVIKLIVGIGFLIMKVFQ